MLDKNGQEFFLCEWTTEYSKDPCDWNEPLHQGPHFSGLTKFPDFSSIFAIFQYFLNVFFFFLNWKLDPLWQIIHSSFKYY